MAARTTRHPIRRTEGFIFPTALLLLLLITTFGGSLVVRSMTHMTVSERSQQLEHAFHLAEGGLDHGLTVLAVSNASWNDELRGPDGLGGTADDGVLSFGPSVSLGSGSYEVRVSDNQDETPPASDDPMTDVDRIVKVVSTGIMGDNQRQVRVFLDRSLFDHAIAADVDIVSMEASFFGDIHANRDITVTESGVLVGDAEATASGSFVFAPGTTLVHTEGDLVGGDPPIDFLQPDVTALQDSVNNPNPPGWSGDTITLLDGDVAGYDMGVDITPNTIDLTGSATLVMFQGNSVVFLEKLGTVDAMGNCTALLDLNIVVVGGGSLAFNETACIRGLIWAEGAIALGEKSTIQGAIVSAESTITVSEKSQIAFDPDAIDWSLLSGFWGYNVLTWEEL